MQIFTETKFRVRSVDLFILHIFPLSGSVVCVDSEKYCYGVHSGLMSWLSK